MRQKIERDRMRIKSRRWLQIFPCHLTLQFVNAAGTTAGDGLETGREHAPHTKDTMQRVKRPRSNAGEQRRQLARVLQSGAAAQSVDCLAMVSLERRLRGPLPVNREAEKNVGSPD